MKKGEKIISHSFMNFSIYCKFF